MSGIPGSGEQMALWGANEPASARMDRHDDVNEDPSKGSVEAASDGIVTIDQDGLVTFANSAICNALGVPLGELIGSQLFGHVVPDDADRVRQFLAEHDGAVGCGPVDLRLLARGGSFVSFQGSRINLMHDGVVRGGVWHLRNLDEVRAAQSSVAWSEAISKALATETSDVTFVVDSDTRIKYASDSVFHTFGYTRAEVEGMLSSELVDLLAHPDDRHVLEAYDMLGAAPGDKGVIRCRGRRPDGGWLWIEGSYFNLLHDPEVGGLVVNVRDVSEQHVAGVALAESEARYRTIVEIAEEGIWMFNADGVSTFATPKLAKLLGTSVEELIGVGYGQYSAGEAAQADAALRWRRRQRGLADSYETKLRGADGSVIDVRVAATPLHNTEGAMIGSLAMITDLTHEKEIERERTQLREQREQDQRLASLGQLAGGVAHDFNNLLGIIMNFALLAEQEVTSRQAIADLGQIRQASERAATLTAQLLAFASRQVVNPELVAVNGLVADFATMLGRTLGGQMDLQIELERGVVEPIVLFDRNRLEHILLNLAINARDAMPGGGTVMIRTSVQIGPEQRSGLWVSIRVTDDGVGMEPEVAARAFEPFFTTKALGAGTGLGLATVHGLVAQGGGRVVIESTPGHGTSIEILLPLHAAADVAAVRSVDSIPSGTERILVVDDEPALRQATARILRLHEYDVLEAADGAAALAILDAPESAIDLVLTDISMKHMSGRELGAEIARRNTATPVIYITGYNSPESGTTPGRVLHKPVAEAALLGAIRDELDRIHT